MLSMTGYGRGRAEKDGRELTVEVKTVNHRYLDLAFRLPRELTFLEDVFRQELAALRRGHAEVSVLYRNSRSDAQEVLIDQARLKAFCDAMEGCSSLFTPFREATAAEVLELSGAVTIVPAQEDTEAVIALASSAMREALEGLSQMRQREGENLAWDLNSNLALFSALRERISRKAPGVPEEYRQRLLERLSDWSLGDIDPQRIAQEVAILADHCAIDEELSRLESHISQFRETMQTGLEAGRKLDFLLQEMNREVNTIGSKASDGEIAQAVVDAKCILEKLREQVQNVL